MLQAVASTIICSLMYCLARFGLRLYYATAGGRKWCAFIAACCRHRLLLCTCCSANSITSWPHGRSLRRARLCGTYFALLVIQLLNASMYLVPNVCVLHKNCRAGPLVNWAGVSTDVQKPQQIAVSFALCARSHTGLITAVPGMWLAGSPVDLLEHIVRNPCPNCARRVHTGFARCSLNSH